MLETYKYHNGCADKFHILDENFDQAIIYNSEQVSGLLEMSLKSKTNPIQMLSYPQVGTASIKINYAKEECEVLVIDEIGKFSVESENFVNCVRSALQVDKPTLLTLHKKSRHPLLQDIRRRDDGRILEVTPVNRALLPYKIHKLMRETY